ncbi:MAG: hypothetical protein ACE5LH_04780 [Fidelibacterota bacterium]
MGPLARSVLTLFFLSSVNLPAGTPAPAPKWLNLYVLDFDNLRSDPSVAWLGQGLADMLRQRFGELDGVRTLGREDLERILQDRTGLLRQPAGTRNVLVMGTFVRDLDRVTANVQLIDIATWEEMGRTSSAGSVNQITGLTEELFSGIRQAIQKEIPPQEGVAALPGRVPTAEPPEYARQVQDINVSMSSALEDLEEAMDLAIGARQKGEETVESHGRYTRDFSFDPSGASDEMPRKDLDALETILSIISRNPYKVTIGKPGIEVPDRKETDVILSIPVVYSLRENLIRDLLSTLPFTGIREDGSLTTLEFSRKKFPISSRLSDDISRGAFRVIPVIQVLDRGNVPRTVVVDTPDPYWHRQTSSNVILKTEHIFSPLVAFSVSGWSLQVTMESVDIEATYKVSVPRDDLQDYSRVQLEFVPEPELSDFLSAIL